MTDSLVLIERHGAIAVVKLNRPEALNALSSALRRRLSGTFAELSGDRSTEVIILTGAGRAFTVGLDLKELGGEGPANRGAHGESPPAGKKPIRTWAAPTSATHWQRRRSRSSPQSTATPSPAASSWR